MRCLQTVATGCTVRGSNPGGGEIFRTHPDRPWGPPSLLYNGHRSRAIPLLPLWVFVPCSRENFTFTFCLLAYSTDRAMKERRSAERRGNDTDWRRANGRTQTCPSATNPTQTGPESNLNLRSQQRTASANAWPRWKGSLLAQGPSRINKRDTTAAFHISPRKLPTGTQLSIPTHAQLQCH